MVVWYFCCGAGGGRAGLAFLPFHVACNDAGEAGGEGEDHADVVARLDALAWFACRGCDDEDDHCGGDDEGEVEKCGKGDEADIACEERAPLFLRLRYWLMMAFVDRPAPCGSGLE